MQDALQPTQKSTDQNPDEITCERTFLILAGAPLSSLEFKHLDQENLKLRGFSLKVLVLHFVRPSKEYQAFFSNKRPSPCEHIVYTVCEAVTEISFLDKQDVISFTMPTLKDYFRYRTLYKKIWNSPASVVLDYSYSWAWKNELNPREWSKKGMAQVKRRYLRLKRRIRALTLQILVWQIKRIRLRLHGSDSIFLTVPTSHTLRDLGLEVLSNLGTTIKTSHRDIISTQDVQCDDSGPIVYLDSLGTFHPDHILSHKSELNGRAKNIDGLRSILPTLDAIAIYHKRRVIIAAHPKGEFVSDFVKTAYDPFTVRWGSTPESVARAPFVIGEVSGALAIAVFLRKPIIILTHALLTAEEREWGEIFADKTGCGLHNCDAGAPQIKVPSIDETKYKNFIERYLTENETENNGASTTVQVLKEVMRSPYFSESEANATCA